MKPTCRIDDLLRPDVLAAFDRDRFERDGYWSWEGILTDAGRRQWTASLRRMQQMSDAMVMDTDWGAIDCEGLGLPPIPPEHLTRDHRASACGGKEIFRLIPVELRHYMHNCGLFDPPVATRGFKSEGFLPEYFAPGYDDSSSTSPLHTRRFSSSSASCWASVL